MDERTIQSRLHVLILCVPSHNVGYIYTLFGVILKLGMLEMVGTLIDGESLTDGEDCSLSMRFDSDLCLAFNASI